MNPRRKKPARRKIPQAPKAAESYTLKIESVAFGGDGIARLEGKVYFVADALPGQTVEVEITDDKGRFAKGRILRIIAEAESARPAPCIYAESCGGCQWQKAPYAEQLTWKASFIRDALQRIGGIAPDSYAFSMHASPAEDAYRNRIDLKFRILANGCVELGYFGKASHELVRIQQCLIADPLINQVLPYLNKMRFSPRNRVFETSLQLQRIAASSPQVLIYGEHWPKDVWQELIDQIQANAWLSAHIEQDAKAFVLLEQWQGLHFFTRAGQFQQINLAANHILRQWVLETAQAYQVSSAIDLYCGSGNLSLGMAKSGIKIFGVETYAPSIDAACYNRQINQLELTASYATGEAHNLRSVFPDLPKVDMILVDPPRRGMAEAIEPVLQIGARLMIYISCDPNTLARDLKRLLSSGYELKSVKGLDFFPQSYHIETACLLIKS